VDGDQTPDVDPAAQAVTNSCAEEGAICGDGYGSDALIFFRYKLMAALVLAEIPYSHVAAAIAGDELSLVGVDYDVVDRDTVGVVALDRGGLRIPDLDSA
jgi:hypothetical protein